MTKQKFYTEQAPDYAGFSQTHKIGNINIINIIANFLFLFICSFLLYLHHVKLVNVKLDVSGL